MLAEIMGLIREAHARHTSVNDVIDDAVAAWKARIDLKERTLDAVIRRAFRSMVHDFRCARNKDIKVKVRSSVRSADVMARTSGVFIDDPEAVVNQAQAYIECCILDKLLGDGRTLGKHNARELREYARIRVNVAVGVKKMAMLYDRLVELMPNDDDPVEDYVTRQRANELWVEIDDNTTL